MFLFFSWRGSLSHFSDECHPKFWVRLWGCTNGDDTRSSCALLCLMGVVSMHILYLPVHARVISLLSLYAVPFFLLLAWCSCPCYSETVVFLCFTVHEYCKCHTRAERVSLYIQAAGHKWGQVVSKKLCDSKVRSISGWNNTLRCHMMPPHHSVSQITSSISLDMNCILPYLSSSSIWIVSFSFLLSLFLSALYTSSTYYGQPVLIPARHVPTFCHVLCPSCIIQTC